MRCSVLAFNVFRNSYLVSIPQENTPLTFLFSVAFVVSSLTFFVVPSVSSFIAAVPTVSYLRAARLGAYANVTEGLPNFTFELTWNFDPRVRQDSNSTTRLNDSSQDPLHTDLSSFVDVFLFHRKVYSGTFDKESTVRIAFSPPKCSQTSRGYRCFYRCHQRLELQVAGLRSVQAQQSNLNGGCQVSRLDWFGHHFCLIGNWERQP